MKTIAFFNEKGGVGKSIMNVMFASWLQYKHGLKVGLADFNDRIENNRANEVAARRRLGTYDALKDREPWPIASVDHNFVRNCTRRKLFGNAMWFDAQIKNGPLKDRDVVVVDFPGSLDGGSFTELVSYRLVSQVVLVCDADKEVMLAALNMNKMVTSMVPEVNVMGFVNKARLNQKNYERKYYEEVKDPLMKLGLRLLPDTVSYSERIINLDRPDIMRSSLTYPDWDSPAFAGGRDLGIENLFTDVARELRRSMEIRGTGTADLSFVDSLSKTDDGRQFRGSSFPEYEI